MKVPDKIWVNTDTLNGYYMSNHPPCGEEYIRKEVVDETIETAEDHAYFAGREKMREELLKWLQEARAVPHDGALIRDRAFQEVINHINEM